MKLIKRWITAIIKVLYNVFVSSTLGIISVSFFFFQCTLKKNCFQIFFKNIISSIKRKIFPKWEKKLFCTNIYLKETIWSEEAFFQRNIPHVSWRAWQLAPNDAFLRACARASIYFEINFSGSRSSPHDVFNCWNRYCAHRRYTQRCQVYTQNQCRNKSNNKAVE